MHLKYLQRETLFYSAFTALPTKKKWCSQKGGEEEAKSESLFAQKSDLSEKKIHRENAAKNIFSRAPDTFLDLTPRVP